jgi:hypothetical protein
LCPSIWPFICKNGLISPRLLQRILVFVLIRLTWRSKVASADTTYEYSLLFLFSVLESEVGIILACIPVMQPALRRIAKVGPLKRMGSFFTQKEITEGNFSLPNGSAGVSMRHGMHRLNSSNDDTESISPFGDHEQGIEMDSGHIYRGDGIKVTQTWTVRC